MSVAVSESEWERDLKVLLFRPPEYSEVVEEVADNLGRRGLDLR